MNMFNVRLLVSDEHKKAEIEVKTCDFEFGKSMVEHVNEFKSSPAVLSLKTAEGYQLVQQAEIIFIEVLQKEVSIYLMDRQIIVRQTLASTEELLDKTKFIRISKSTIINSQMLQRIELAFSGNYYGFLIGEHKVVISRRYFQALKNKLNL